MRKQTFYVEDFKEIDVCGKSILYLEGGAYELPYAIKPADGEHNLENCEGCRNQLKYITERIREHAKDFPNCCEWHKKAKKLTEFRHSDFLGLEESVAQKCIFTYQHFINHYENDDYFEDFTNYYEYVIRSLGSFPKDCGAPYQSQNFYSFLKELISNKKGKLKSDKISEIELDIRIGNIIKYIEDSYIPINKKEKSDTNRDLNLLLVTYDKWYKTFPFDFPYFTHLKEKFSKTLPILNGKPIYNKYTGLTKSKIQSKEGLTKFLIELTNNIIQNINGLKLYEVGLLTDVENIKLELILKNRKLELIELESINNSDRKGYIKALKYWFKTEKKFIDEITPILKDKRVDNKNESKLNINQIALKLYYEGSIVNRANSNEIIKQYGHNSGDSLFNRFTYYSSTANRKGSPEPATKKRFQNKISLFESVIDLLDNDKKQRAVDELNIIKLNYQTQFD